MKPIMMYISSILNILYYIYICYCEGQMLRLAAAGFKSGSLGQFHRFTHGSSARCLRIMSVGL